MICRKETEDSRRCCSRLRYWFTFEDAVALVVRWHHLKVHVCDNCFSLPDELVLELNTRQGHPVDSLVEADGRFRPEGTRPVHSGNRGCCHW